MAQIEPIEKQGGSDPVREILAFSVDRLTHHIKITELNSESYRLVQVRAGKFTEPR